MASLTKKQVDLFRYIAKNADLYGPDDPKVNQYDGKYDGKRLASLRAREILAAHGVPIEPQEGEDFPDDE